MNTWWKREEEQDSQGKKGKGSQVVVKPFASFVSQLFLTMMMITIEEEEDYDDKDEMMKILSSQL